MAEVYALREHCINFKGDFKNGERFTTAEQLYLLEEALVDWSRVSSETGNNVTVPIRALRANIRSLFPHFHLLSTPTEKAYQCKGLSTGLELLILPVNGKQAWAQNG